VVSEERVQDTKKVRFVGGGYASWGLKARLTRQAGGGEVGGAELSSSSIGAQSLSVESRLEVLQRESVLEDVGVAEERKNNRERSAGSVDREERLSSPHLQLS